MMHYELHTALQQMAAGDSAAAMRFTPTQAADEQQCQLQDKHIRMSLHAWQFPLFYIAREHYFSDSDCIMSIRRKDVPSAVFSYVTQGTAVRTNEQRREWNALQTNIEVLPPQSNLQTLLQANKPFEVVSLFLSQPFMEQLAERNDKLLYSLVKAMQQQDYHLYYKENCVAAACIQRAMRDIEQCKAMGNYAETYLQSKISECLSAYLLIDETFAGIDISLRNKMYEARTIMQERFCEPPALHELALMVGTNECTLKHAFRQEFGTTVFGFLFDYRMQRAAEYLLDTSLPIADIALRTGYEYQSHFCTAFRRKFGMSPSEFRAKRKMS